jgi:hypothetical protein
MLRSSIEAVTVTSHLLRLRLGLEETEGSLGDTRSRLRQDGAGVRAGLDAEPGVGAEVVSIACTAETRGGAETGDSLSLAD